MLLHAISTNGLEDLFPWSRVLLVSKLEHLNSPGSGGSVTALSPSAAHQDKSPTGPRPSGHTAGHKTQNTAEFQCSESATTALGGTASLPEVQGEEAEAWRVPGPGDVPGPPPPTLTASP